MTWWDAAQIVLFLFILIAPWEMIFVKPINRFFEWLDED